MAAVALVSERRANLNRGRSPYPGSKEIWVAGFAAVERTAADDALGPMAAAPEVSQTAASSRFAVQEVG